MVIEHVALAGTGVATSEDEGEFVEEVASVNCKRTKNLCIRQYPLIKLGTRKDSAKKQDSIAKYDPIDSSKCPVVLLEISATRTLQERKRELNSSSSLCTRNYLGLP
jgi:hypothetical protein